MLLSSLWVCASVLQFVGAGDDPRSCRFSQMMEQRLERVFSEARAKVLPTNTKLSVQVRRCLTLSAVCRWILGFLKAGPDFTPPHWADFIVLAQKREGILLIRDHVKDRNQVQREGAEFISHCLQQIRRNEAVLFQLDINISVSW